MAHSLSAKKRIRQNAKRNAMNRARKQDMKLSIRSFSQVLASGDVGKAEESLKAVIKSVDQKAAKGTIHKNAASRKKSQLQRRFNALKSKG